MPTIRLKPRSAEFDDQAEEKARSEGCDMPGCSAHGEFKAPRHRALNEYYMFCLQHVQEYNKAWDYFAGMSASDIEDHIIKSALWDRPTRRFDNHAHLEEELKRKAWQSYNFTDREPPKDDATQQRYREQNINRNSPEYEAMAIMGLEPPLDMKGLKTRYKELVKKHHPDLNPGDPKAEELLKRINMAYTLLRLAHEQFEELPDR